MALIYIVEDDISIQEIERFALSNAGYQVEGFASAEKFYEALKEKAPDAATEILKQAQCDTEEIYLKAEE